MTEEIKSEQSEVEEGEQPELTEEQALAEAEASLIAGHQRVTEKQGFTTSPEIKPDDAEDKPPAQKPDDDGDKPAAEAPDDKDDKGEKKDESGQKPDEKEDKPAEKPDADGKKDQGPEDPDPATRSLQRRMRKIEGTIGGISEKLDSLSEAIKTKAEDVTTSAEAGETKEQIDAALKNLKDLEALGEDMEALKPVIDELKDLRSQMATREQQPDTTQAQPQAQTEQLSPDEIVERVTLNLKHPGWEGTTQKPEFKEFVLGGGPTGQEYDEYAALANDQKTEREAAELVKGWAEDYPKWWESKGQRFFEGSVTDSISLLDEFSAAQKAATDKQQQQQQQKAQKVKRLENALTPEGVGDDPAQGIDDEAAFSRGYKKVAGKTLLR